MPPHENAADISTIWSQLREAQDVLVSMGYTFNVSEKHHTVYRDDIPLFGFRLELGESKDNAMLSHWSSAIATSLAHAKIYRGSAMESAPKFEQG